MNNSQSARATRQITWFILLGSITVYAAMPMAIAGSEAPLEPMLVTVLAVVAAMTGIASFVVPGVIRRIPSKNSEERAARSYQALLVGWALCETIAIYGLVLYVLGAGTTWLWGLSAVAFILMGMQSPRDPEMSLDGASGAGAMDSHELARPDVKIG